MRDWLRLFARLAVLTAVAAFIAVVLRWGNSQLRQDECLDRGGTWNAETRSCVDAAYSPAD